jgi:hypothetical protein
MKLNILKLSLAMVVLFALQSCDSNSSRIEDSMDHSEKVLSTDLVNNPNSDGADSVGADQTGLLVFDHKVHDFGNLKNGEIIQHDFEYENKGSKEVIILNAKGSCGCTVPEYEDDPIPPGGKGVLKVTFNSDGKMGYNEKNVQITTNGVPSKYRLTILAKVD